MILWVTAILVMTSPFMLAEEKSPKGPAADKDTIPVDILLSAPERIGIEGRAYTLRIYAWRDFMPICPPGGKPLIVIARLLADDLSKVPPSLDIRRIWVIYEGEAWLTKFEKGDTAEKRFYNNCLEKLARNGPKWGPGVIVDVVIEVVDGEGKTYLLKAARQRIERTS
jgi:hypothetical protein